MPFRPNRVQRRLHKVYKNSFEFWKESSCRDLNPRPTGTPDFPPPTGGGRGLFEQPPSTRLLLVVEKNGRKHSKARQKWLRNYFSDFFFAKVKIVAPRAKKLQNFRVFRDCQTSFRKTSIISGTIIPRANPKTAFERKLHSPSLVFRQIWPEVNGLASNPEDTEVKKAVFERTLSPLITFSFLYVQ